MLLLMLVAGSVEPAIADGQPTPLELRARKLAARRYAGMAVALPLSAFVNGLHVCARETPSGIAGYWKITPKAMARIDADLLVHLRKSGLDKRLPFSPRLYLRQYAGFVRDGERLVYVNALLVEKGKPLVDQAQKTFPQSCAEASGTWGIQYDTETKQFSAFTKT
jgi:hypothetical protein